MQKKSVLYDFTQNLGGQVFFAAFKTHLTQEQRDDWTNRPPVMNIKRGYAESPGWIMVQAQEFAPEPLSVAKFRKRAVYSAPKLTLGLLELLASEQYFDTVGDDYYLTAKGHEAIEKSANFRKIAFEGFEPIDAGKIDKIVTYTGHIIDESLKADDSPGTWCLAHSRNRAPDKSAPPLAKLLQYSSDFNSFRDDAHMAAFGKHNVEGHVWEAFSYIKDEQANNASSLYEKLAYRGFYTEDWQTALNELAGRGWIMQNGDNYAATDEGLAISKEIEKATDDYFFAPWKTLSDDEYEELINLMQLLSETCQALTA